MMKTRSLMACLILGGFILSAVPLNPERAEAAQTTAKKKKKKVEQKNQYQHGLKKYPWGEPNAGWSDRCIFFFDTYDGWIPPICRPYGR